MRQSQLFTKTLKESPKDEVSINSILLMRAGYIYKEMAGVYSYLPLGQKVLSKIENIIREEMNTLGQEVLMSSIVPKQIWEQTKRIDSIDVLMKTTPANKVSQEKNDSEYILNPTHEDVVTPILQKYAKTYKDFPIAVYQIQTKFRNEPRAKSGLLRCREFRMKDLYSFHTSTDDLGKFYEKAKEVYKRIFERLGIGDDTMIVLASGGDFTKDNSHEFQTRCEAGEDIVFYDSSINVAYNREIAPSKAPVSDVNKNTEIKDLDEVFGENIIGVDDLVEFLKIKPEQTTKTIIFETDNQRIIAAAVRGDYDINEEKLQNLIDAKKLSLASEEIVMKATGAKIGYAGIINLPDNVELYLDDSIKGMVNFETGANKTNYHAVNVNFGRDIKEPEKFYDFKIAKQGDINPDTGEKYEVFKASEVGNIFPLNTKFTKACNYKYIDKDGNEEEIYMGSYGIGPTRVMGVLVEKFHDEKGIIWPEQVAPFKVHLLAFGNDKDVIEAAEKVYSELQDNEIEVLFDDRDDSPGSKLADSDLIGIPYRVIISSRSLSEKSAEIKKRDELDSKLVKLNDLMGELTSK